MAKSKFKDRKELELTISFVSQFTNDVCYFYREFENPKFYVIEDLRDMCYHAQKIMSLPFDTYDNAQSALKEIVPHKISEESTLCISLIILPIEKPNEDWLDKATQIHELEKGLSNEKKNKLFAFDNEQHLENLKSM